MAPLEISFSKIQAYERCPYLYRLVFLEGWRAGPHARQAMGQSLHRTLAAFMSPENKDRSLDALLVTFDEHWLNEGFKTPEETFEFYEAGRKILENFFIIIADRSDETVGAEMTFRVEFGPVALMGTIDRVDRLADGRYAVVEYKSNDRAWPEERIRNDLQMTLYDLGVRKGFGVEPAVLAYHFLDPGRIVRTERTDSDREEAITLVLTTAEKIQAGRFEPNRAWCPRCEFKNRCPESSLKR